MTSRKNKFSGFFAQFGVLFDTKKHTFTFFMINRDFKEYFGGLGDEK